jgi:hypothetical protein
MPDTWGRRPVCREIEPNSHRSLGRSLVCLWRELRARSAPLLGIRSSGVLAGKGESAPSGRVTRTISVTIARASDTKFKTRPETVASQVLLFQGSAVASETANRRRGSSICARAAVTKPLDRSIARTDLGSCIARIDSTSARSAPYIAPCLTGRDTKPRKEFPCDPTAPASDILIIGPPDPHASFTCSVIYSPYYSSESASCLDSHVPMTSMI